MLGGGASYGAVQVGHLRALAETDITPDFVVGTSVGSLNGAVVAENPGIAHDRLVAWWANMNRQAVFGNVFGTALNLATGKASAVPNTGLRAVIESAMDARTFEELAIPHTAVTTDFSTGEAVPISEGDLVSALLASAAILLVFPRSTAGIKSWSMAASSPMCRSPSPPSRVPPPSWCSTAASRSWPSAGGHGHRSTAAHRRDHGRAAGTP